MKKVKNLLSRTIVLVIILILLATAAGCTCSSSADSPGTSAEELGLIVLEEDLEAPVFTLSTLDGSDITLSDFRGGFVVINFWTTHCPPCVAEMKYFEAASKEYPDELTILTVDIMESEANVSEFFGDGERSFIVPLDNTGEVSSVYGIRYTPTTFFLDVEGNVLYAKIGAFVSQQQFENSVALLLESA